ncbi:unnamed protein product, partial [Amoebophrya sp. A120]
SRASAGLRCARSFLPGVARPSLLEGAPAEVRKPHRLCGVQRGRFLCLFLLASRNPTHSRRFPGIRSTAPCSAPRRRRPYLQLTHRRRVWAASTDFGSDGRARDAAWRCLRAWGGRACGCGALVKASGFCCKGRPRPDGYRSPGSDFVRLGSALGCEPSPPSGLLGANRAAGPAHVSGPCPDWWGPAPFLGGLGDTHRNETPDGKDEAAWALPPPP